jgi:phage regulator Rha-like protein
MKDLALIKETMSSIEIAELTGKQHKHVLEAIRTMEPAWGKVCGSKFRLTSKNVEMPNGGFKEIPCYELTKTECLYVATKFNDEARAKLVLRWEQLEKEKQSQNALPGNYLEALKSLVESEEQKQQLLIQNEIQAERLKIVAPKADYYDRTLMAKNTVSTTVIAKELGMSAITLNKKLKEMGIQYKVGQTWVLTSKYQNMGYTDTQTYTETIDDETRSYVSTVWTQKGREFIHSLFHSNKESTLFSEVSELKNAIREEDDLKTRIESLGKPILNDMKQIPLLLDKYKMMIAKDKLSVYERKVFLFVVVSLFDPKALAGKKMKHGLREVIGSSLGFENKSTISDNMNDISSYYTRTPKFRKDTKRAFMCIGGYQAN